MVVDRRERVREVFFFFAEDRSRFGGREGAMLVTNPIVIHLLQQQRLRAWEDVWVQL